MGVDGPLLFSLRSIQDVRLELISSLPMFPLNVQSAKSNPRNTLITEIQRLTITTLALSAVHVLFDWYELQTVSSSLLNTCSKGSTAVPRSGSACNWI